MRRGFTLVEMLVVLVVIGLIVSLAPAAFERLLPGRRLDAAARQLADTLRTARSLAIRDDRSRFVVIDVGARTAGIDGARSSQQLPDTVSVSLVVASTEQPSPETGRIRFYPDGTSTGGEVALNMDHRSVKVIVDWFNGQVSLIDAPAS
jgi:general secretion pathway protein H